MKEWNAPSIEELNVTETANGFLNSDVEFWWVSNDSKSSTQKPNESIKPGNPGNSDGPVDSLS